jgi:hypothetical protein
MTLTKKNIKVPKLKVASSAANFNTSDKYNKRKTLLNNIHNFSFIGLVSGCSFNILKTVRPAVEYN